MRPRSRPITVRPYCCTNLSFKLKTVLCDHIVAPIPRLKLKQQKSEIKIGATILSHQFHILNKNSKVRQRSRPKSMRPYCRTNSSFETNTVLCDHIIAQIPSKKLCDRCYPDLAPKLSDQNVAPIRLMKQNQYCAIILSHQFNV